MLRIKKKNSIPQGHVMIMSNWKVSSIPVQKPNNVLHQSYEIKTTEKKMIKLVMQMVLRERLLTWLIN